MFRTEGFDDSGGEDRYYALRGRFGCAHKGRESLKMIRRQEVTKHERLAYKQFPLTIARYRVLTPLVDQNEPARFFSFSERNC
jgi:hypothetical protein